MRKVTKIKGDIPDTLGGRIAYLRTHKGLSQQKLAEEIYIKRELLNMIENNSRSPKIEILKDISKTLDTTTDFLLCLSHNPSSDMCQQEITKQTGLSESAINFLTRLNLSFEERIKTPLLNWDKLNSELEQMPKSERDKLFSMDETAEKLIIEIPDDGMSEDERIKRSAEQRIRIDNRKLKAINHILTHGSDLFFLHLLNALECKDENIDINPYEDSNYTLMINLLNIELQEILDGIRLIRKRVLAQKTPTNK